MLKLFQLSIFVLFFFFYKPAFSQTLTEKDFKLLIDKKSFPDSATSITVNDLLMMKEVTANFTWISFKSLVLYFDFVTREERSYTYDGMEIAICPGTIICDKAKKLMKQLRPGNIIIFEAYQATNKTGSKLNIQKLVFVIR